MSTGWWILVWLMAGGSIMFWTCLTVSAFQKKYGKPHWAAWRWASRVFLWLGIIAAIISLIFI